MHRGAHDEQPVWIALNGVRRVVLSCSPHEPAALALGHLFAEGWIGSAADVLSLSVSDDEAARTGVSAQVDPEQLNTAELVRRHQTLHGCGLRHALDCDPYGLPPVQPPALPIDTVALLRSLFAAADDLAPGGGVHATALSDGSTLIAPSIDIARHCAVDRTLGIALAANHNHNLAANHNLAPNHDLSELGLVCTARISGAIAMKAIRARLGWIVSRSIATSLARELADAYGLLLLERAGKPLPHA